PMPTPSINGPGAVVIRNLNPGVDQNPDLIVSTGGGINVLLGNGNGTFGTPTVLAAGASPNWVAVDDFNNDGKLDLAVAEDSSGAGVYILLGHGDGTFDAAQPVSAGGNSSYLLTGDFNRDGKLALAVVNKFSDTLCLFPGHGDGTFGAKTRYVVGSFPDWVATADLNMDGKFDLAVTNSASGTITLLETPTPTVALGVNV